VGQDSTGVDRVALQAVRAALSGGPTYEAAPPVKFAEKTLALLGLQPVKGWFFDVVSGS